MFYTKLFKRTVTSDCPYRSCPSVLPRVLPTRNSYCAPCHRPSPIAHRPLCTLSTISHNFTSHRSPPRPTPQPASSLLPPPSPPSTQYYYTPTGHSVTTVIHPFTSRKSSHIFSHLRPLYSSSFSQCPTPLYLHQPHPLSAMPVVANAPLPPPPLPQPLPFPRPALAIRLTPLL